MNRLTHAENLFSINSFSNGKYTVTYTPKLRNPNLKSYELTVTPGKNRTTVTSKHKGMKLVLSGTGANTVGNLTNLYLTQERKKDEPPYIHVINLWKSFPIRIAQNISKDAAGNPKFISLHKNVIQKGVGRASTYEGVARPDYYGDDGVAFIEYLKSVHNRYKNLSNLNYHNLMEIVVMNMKDSPLKNRLMNRLTDRSWNLMFMGNVTGKNSPRSVLKK